MGLRSELHTILKDILESDNVYFQPPPNVVMAYPCIIYQRSDVNIQHADNSPYKHLKRYQVTVVDQNPDSSIPDRVSNLPTCTFDRFYVADNLNHDVYNLYF